jgi:XRE family transcriptional regulator, regulator of sulfur utilization
MAARGILRALGQELRAHRLEKGWSQEELADRSRLHANYIGLLERGQRNPTVLTLLEVTKQLGVPLSALFSKLDRRD